MEMRQRLLGVTVLAARYCSAVETVAETEREDFIAGMLQLLPRIYIEFNDIVPGGRKRRGGDHHSHGDECHCGDENCHSHSHGEECHCDDDGCHCEECECDDYGCDCEDMDAGTYYGSYVDEDYYENVRRHMEQLLGPDDVFLETFEEDMKYSDTPIAASIAESLADIFQPLYNFVAIVRESDGEELEGAYRECHDNFAAYWGQTLCNVLRALNHLYYRG